MLLKSCVQYGKHLLQQQKDELEKIKDLAEAAEERRKKEEKRLRATAERSR